MAVFDSNRGIYRVERGDTLWDIARENLIKKGGGTPSNKEIVKEVRRLASLNNLPNEDVIYIDQTINTAPPSSGEKPKRTPTGMVSDLQMGLLSTSEDTLYAFWSDLKVADTASYKLLWTYTTLSGVELIDGPNTNTVDKDYPKASRQVTYRIPSGATKVKLKVMPVAKTEDNNGSETAKYNGKWSKEVSYTVTNPLETPKAPSLTRDEQNGLKLTAELENLDIDANSIEFQLVKDDTKIVEKKKVSINKTTNYAAYSWSQVDTGSEYKVCCRAVKGKLYSDWSAYSNGVSTIPAKPSRAPTVTATDETTVYATWDAVKAATGYDLQYTTDKKFFDTSDTEVTTKSVTDGTAYYVTNLESGKEYFFRLRAKNSAGESGWTDIVSVIIGEAPAAPTTWSSTTTAIVGEKVILYWVHNSEDGSSETKAKLQLYINESPLKEIVIVNTATDDEKDLTKFYEFDTSPYTEGTKLQWKVQTMGITNEYGDWSVQRTVDIYAQPTLNLRITDLNGDPVSAISSFPIRISALPGPETQNPIGYHLSVTADTMYETVDRIGNEIVINAGEEVYSQHFDTKMDLEVTLSAGDIDLEQNVSYTITCTVTMDSGLNAEKSITLPVTWSEEMYTPNASIGIDIDSYTAYITPYCESTHQAYRVVEQVNGEYVTTGATVYYAYGDPVEDAYAATGERVYNGVDGDGNEILFYEADETESVEDVFLSVYRREFDGSFVEIASGIPNTKATTVTDPHPALDYARYRIVATSAKTGAVGYYDMPGYPVGGNAVIIQWDEAWTNFEVAIDEELAQPPWSGSLLKLPYNIDVSDSHDTDVSLIEYIGRSRPVSYYGTHLGEKSTWSLSIDKSDKETLYALRRLAIWMGDVYVREPSGSGYWAHVSVSFSQKHKDVTIPVTLDITRVEGGV